MSDENKKHDELHQNPKTDPSETEKHNADYAKKDGPETAGEPDSDDAPAESNAARLLRMRGISVEPEPPAEPVRGVGRLANIWYHYKSIILAVTAGIIIIAIGVAQLVARGDPEYYIMYAGPAYYDAGGTEEFIAALRSLTESDDTDISLMTATCFTDDKIAERQREYEERGIKFEFDIAFNNSEFERFRNEFMVGNSVIFLLDPELYEEMNEHEIFAELSDVLGYTPDCAADKCAVRFSELEFAKYYTVFDALPDDTLLAVRNISPIASYSDSKDNVNAQHRELFRKIIEFRCPEENETEADGALADSTGDAT